MMRQRLCTTCLIWHRTSAACPKCGATVSEPWGARTDLTARVDGRWSRENRGRGHYVHQEGAYVSSRAALRRWAKRHEKVIVGGPMGSNIGTPAPVKTQAELHLDRKLEVKQRLVKARKEAVRNRRPIRL